MKPRLIDEILNEKKAQLSNALINETSPYLLQHAHNPVHWHPWTQEVLAKAKAENKPILLSIGYSTCHWCHVMEHESFEDPEIAEYLNQHYVAIKVDREERPDLDSYFMHVLQSMIGHGGWPMTLWLMPDQKPFYGGTYFPARDGDRGSQVGFLTLLQKLHQLFETQPQEIQKQAFEISQYANSQLNLQRQQAFPSTELFDKIYHHFDKTFDAACGGFGGAPKFPRVPVLNLLYALSRDPAYEKAKQWVEKTLTSMANGGIYDQVGGGFHRYSVDRQWIVPHFEKMLYDQAQLLDIYTKAYLQTADPRYFQILSQTCAYLIREMKDGAFFSATDADTQGEEGLFFTWTIQELESFLSPNELELCKQHFGVTLHGNFEGRNIFTCQNPKNIADEEIQNLQEKIYIQRSMREKPLTDDKIVAAYNGLMIQSLSQASLVLGKDCLDHALEVIEYIQKNLWDGTHLYRSARKGRKSSKAFLEDYCFLIHGLLAYFARTFDLKVFEFALQLQATADDQFWDVEHGGYWMSSDQKMEKPSEDGATPSGNSVALQNLLHLSLYEINPSFFQKAQEILKLFGSSMDQYPSAYPLMVEGYYQMLHPKPMVIFVEGEKGVSMEQFQLWRKKNPDWILQTSLMLDIAKLLNIGENSHTIGLLQGKLGSLVSRWYICTQGHCSAPLENLDQLVTAL